MIGEGAAPHRGRLRLRLVHHRRLERRCGQTRPRAVSRRWRRDSRRVLRSVSAPHLSVFAISASVVCGSRNGASYSAGSTPASAAASAGSAGARQGECVRRTGAASSGSVSLPEPAPEPPSNEALADQTGDCVPSFLAPACGTHGGARLSEALEGAQERQGAAPSYRRPQVLPRADRRRRFALRAALSVRDGVTGKPARRARLAAPAAASLACLLANAAPAPSEQRLRTHQRVNGLLEAAVRDVVRAPHPELHAGRRGQRRVLLSPLGGHLRGV